jgi:hypothetical protein
MYSIVRRMPEVLARYDASGFAQENAPLLRELRAALSLDPCRYRGFARDPLTPLSSSQLPLVRPECFEARVRMGQLCDEDERLTSVEAAREVMSFLDPLQFEIVEFGSRSPIGFDIGDDEFSILADIAVTPRWYPPHPDDFASVAARLSVLNEHLLFPTAEKADDFLAFYRSRRWAEEGEFTAIGVACI